MQAFLNNLGLEGFGVRASLDATPLFAQKGNGNNELTKAILTHVPKGKIDSNGRLDTATKGAFIDLKMSFIRHRIVKDSEASGLIESMVFVVSQSLKGDLVDVHKDVITFESCWFERLIQMPADHAYRRMDRVELAREVLGDLL